LPCLRGKGRVLPAAQAQQLAPVGEGRGPPYDGSVWVGTPGKVTVFDPTLVALAEFGPEDGIGGRPYALAFDPVRRRACVAGAEANTITVLSGW
jgi:hypothetical protein